MWRNRFTEWMNGNLEFAAMKGLAVIRHLA